MNCTPEYEKHARVHPLARTKLDVYRADCAASQTAFNRAGKQKYKKIPGLDVKLCP